MNNSTCVTDVERVPYCPATEEKWRMAAERKNCSSKIPECPYTDPLKYHCLINAWRNETYELCGVDTEIIGKQLTYIHILILVKKTISREYRLQVHCVFTVCPRG